MAFVELKGSDLVKMVQDRLGGYANALNEDVILDVINEGKDEIWTILKNLGDNYFQTSSRYDDNTQTNYFGPINSQEREYTLPLDFRAIRFIECVTTGFSDVTFVRRSITSPTFREARRAANELSNVAGINVYYYDVAEQTAGTPLVDTEIGTDKTSATASGGFEIVLAQYPETTLQLVLWYLRALPDMETDTILDNILVPYSKKIANFAVEKCMKILQDLQMSSAWLQTWRQDITTVAQSAGKVDQADPQYVQEFLG